MNRERGAYKKTSIGIIPEQWRVSKIGDECYVVSGATPKTDIQEYWENGDIYWATPSDILKTSKSIYKTQKKITELGLSSCSAQLLPIGSILMTSRATIGEKNINRVQMCTNQGFKSFICKENINNEFLYYYLDILKEKLIALASGSTFLEISKAAVSSLEIAIPPLEEQEKIAEILSTWDLALEKQEQLIEKKKEFKKGLMQRLLSGEVRFKEFNDKWKVVSLGSIFERVTDKNNIGSENILTISAQNGLVNQEEYFNKSVSSKDLSGYYLLKKGDFAYNKSYSNGYPLGAIKRLNNYDEGVVSPLYICFRANENISTCFYEQYFEGGFLNKEILKIAQEGARNHGLLNVSVTEFFKDIKIAKPSLEEQNKIAEVLISADKEIELLQKELEALKLQKKGLMQRLLTGEVRVKV